MNNKLAILSVVAIVTAFAASAFVIGLGANDAFAKNNKCEGEQGDGVNVNANVCSVKVCANVDVLGSENSKKCQ
ncbi:hypothetical protein BH23THE1_BH23THE1_30570 [soil metagenome]